MLNIKKIEVRKKSPVDILCLYVCARVIRERSPAADQPRRRTAPCRVEGTASEQWAGTADWTSAASPCAGWTANATPPSSGTAAGKTCTLRTAAAAGKGFQWVFPALHWPCASDSLGCLFEECVWGPIPLFFALAAPCLGPPKTADLQMGRSRFTRKINREFQLVRFVPTSHSFPPVSRFQSLIHSFQSGFFSVHFLFIVNP